MSELFDDDPRATPPKRQAPRRSRALLITAVVVIVAIFALTGFASIYTDRLWYRSAGYGQVFSTLLWTKIGLFLAFGVVFGGAVALNVYLAYRFRPLFRQPSREQTNLDRYRDVVTPIRTWLVIGIGVVVGAFAGTSGMSHWRTYLLWRNAVPFDQKDPYFDRDIGYYVFHLPWQHYLVDFAMAMFVLSIIAALVTHYLYGGSRLQSAQDRLSGAAQVQLSVLLGLFVLAKGVDYYLDRFDLVNQKGSLFTGMNYTAENAVLPAKNILMGVALICAVLFFLNVWRRTWQLPSVGLALLVLSAILLGMIWPAIVQQFQVKPSEADKESPYIQKNIAATRAAYDLEGIEPQAYNPKTTLDQPYTALRDVLNTVPLIDPKQVSPAFENIQQQLGYYSVAPVLDVDRYTIDGAERALVLGVRELDQSRLSPDARNWSNLHTAYTHGSGIIAAYANQRDRNDVPDTVTSTNDGSDAGRILWAQGINPGETDLSDEAGGFESRIYYGEQSPDYSVVGKASADAEDVELNLPVPGSDIGQATTYDGAGDASVGSTFDQLMFAIKFGEPNFLLSGRVNSNSKVLFNRNPQDRVEKVAPWLTVDSDAFPAVVDNRVVWILDGYTTTDRFPNAQRESFETMIDDALQVDTGLQTLPTDEINYMRNAVKATVDAYSGEVTLYAWDDTDPLLKAWEGAFPGTVKPKSQMSPELLQHVRYPEDYFKVQRYQYARYHVEDAGDWYENNDRWAVPLDPQITSTYQAPYRLFVQDKDGTDFSLTSVYVPYKRDNLASFVSVDSDATGDSYGKISVLELNDAANDQGEQTSGPGQVANEFANNNDINAALFPLKQNGAKVTYGNMLTFPIGDGLMYVQPVYVSRQVTNASYPELRYVLAKFGDNVGFGQTFQAALIDLFGSGTTTDPGTTDPGTTDPGTTDPGTPAGTVQEQIDAALDRAIKAFSAAQTALAAGDLGTYQKQVDIAQKQLERVINLRAKRDGTTTPSGGATDTPTDGASATDSPSTPAATDSTSASPSGG
ncbi:UPF0182 family protein [soil metagenome]